MQIYMHAFPYKHIDIQQYTFISIVMCDTILKTYNDLQIHSNMLLSIKRDSLIGLALTQAFSPISWQFDQLETSFMDRLMTKPFSLLILVVVLSIHAYLCTLTSKFVFS